MFSLCCPVNSETHLLLTPEYWASTTLAETKKNLNRLVISKKIESVIKNLTTEGPEIHSVSIPENFKCLVSK